LKLRNVLPLFAWSSIVDATCPMSGYCNGVAICMNFTSLQKLGNAVKYSKNEIESCKAYFNAASQEFTLVANSYTGPLNNQINLSLLISLVQKFLGQFQLTLNFFTGLDLNTLALPSEYMFKYADTPIENLNIQYSASFDLYFNGKLIKLSSDGERSCDETELLNTFEQIDKSFFNFSPDLLCQTPKKKMVRLLFQELKHQPVEFN
jgi:hypothetical protein